MKPISLTQGKVCFVDDKDWAWLLQWGWYAFRGHDTYYAARKDRGKTISMSREILGLTGGSSRVLCDHINKNGLDNRRRNLRIADRSSNAYNSKMSVRNKTGYRGVYWDTEHKKFRAVLGAGRMRRHCGYFENSAEAARAYDAMAIKHVGKHAVLNFPGILTKEELI